MHGKITFVLALALLASSMALADPATLDTFEDPEKWKVIAAEGVEANIRSAVGKNGPCLRLDFDFKGGAGYCVVQRPLKLDLPVNYRFCFDLQGDTPKNNLEFKLLGANGDVWWVNQRDYDFPRKWQTVSYKARQFRFAWGPSGGQRMTNVEALEFAVSAGSGGKGSILIDSLTFEELPEVKPPTRRPRVKVSRGSVGAEMLPIEGRGDVAWVVSNDAAEACLDIDFQQTREFGGLVVEWKEEEYAANYTVSLSDDGKRWTTVWTVCGGNGGRDYIPIPDGEARFLKLAPVAASIKRTIHLANLEIKDISFSQSKNELLKAIAKESVPGAYPRYLLDKQTPWTVIGVADDPREALLGATGSLEVDKGCFSIEPFLIVQGRVVSWADVKLSHSLLDGYLPIPSVTWKHGDIELRITAAADGVTGHSTLLGQYELTSKEHVDCSLVLAVRPFQVLPPWQDLNITGGVAPIFDIVYSNNCVFINDSKTIVSCNKPSYFGCTTFSQGDISEYLLSSQLPERQSLDDDYGLASAALRYDFNLKPNSTETVGLAIPFGDAQSGQHVSPTASHDGHETIKSRIAASAAYWRRELNHAKLTLPKAAERLLNTFRTTQAYILINGDGAAIQPGSRSYERSWIRDGSMTSTALLGTGHTEKVRRFLDWYSGFLFDSGKVPCVVDWRGADHVSEHDSTGQYIYALLKYYRFTGDRKFLAKHFDKVVAGVKYINKLRHERMTDEYRNGPDEKRACFGIVPESISHEGYSAKPMHSYWDNFFVMKGLKDAVTIAEILDKKAIAAEFATTRDEYRVALYDSINLAMKIKGIDYIPGCVELGDFDATSTTVALFPCGEEEHMPQPQLANTFEKYYRFFLDRRDGRTEWDAYTPYELRTVGTFIRLGQAERANELLSFFYNDQRPAGWNQWAEVVWRDEDIPRFIGDMPHTWVGSDFLNAARSMFVYEDESENSLVLAAGIPQDWVTSDTGVGVTSFPTEYGDISYSLSGDSQQTILEYDSVFRTKPTKIVFSIPGCGPIQSARLDDRPLKILGDGEVELDSPSGRVIVLHR